MNKIKTYDITDKMLNELILKKDIQANIARKYDYTPGYISQIAKKIRSLKYPPRIENNELVCYKCKEKEQLQFHHNHQNGQYLAIVCHSCNIKMGDGRNDLDYEDPRIKSLKVKIGQLESDLRKSEAKRKKIENDGSIESLNTQIREVNEQMMRYRTLYNQILRWVEDEKLGYTTKMVNSEIKELEEMEYW